MTRSIDLYELQETDTAVDAAERRLSEIAQELERESDIAILDERIAAAVVELSTDESELHEADAEVVDQKDKIAQMEEKLYGGEVKLPKELKALQDDVQAHQHQLSTMEERALEERGRLVQSLQAEQNDIDSALEQLRTRRDRQKDRVERGDLQLYERLRRARSGRAVSKVERGTCQGCRITLPTTVFQRARSGLKIVQCTSCERILYVV
jgi:predicted  nucleic acid-binding Zn-ribbon protein